MIEYPVFPVKTRVRKKNGYKFPGVIVSMFRTTSDEIRYVVECTAAECKGCLHIFNTEQLELDE